jgi:putative RNA 2'-phosphotransferase
VDPDLARTSRFLSYVLRHHPEAVGLELDPQGWADVDTLLDRVRLTGRTLDRPTLERVVADNDKQRFTFSPDRQRIRAAQGHSVSVDLELTAVPPPAVLFHGTAEKSVQHILADGLRPMGRQYVHLSGDAVSAVAVGQRHGRAVVFVVDAAGAHRAGVHFYRAANGVWLSDPIPVRHLSRAAASG